MNQTIIRIDSDRKLLEGAYESSGSWIPAGTHVELHGRGVDDKGAPYVFGSAVGRLVRFYYQQRYSDNAYRAAGQEPPTASEFEARQVALLKQFDI